MTFDVLFEQLKKKFPAVERLDTKIDPSVKVPKEQIVEVLSFMKSGLNFETISNLGGVDYPKENQSVVFYHPTSYQHKLIVCLKVYVERTEAPEVPSVYSVYKAADWLERETYDMLGVHFTGHPDHRRILLPEDWKAGYPLRKDFVTPDYYNGLPVPLFFNEGGDAPKTTEH